MPAALRLAALKDGEVRINYIGHSTFLIESPKLVRIATDYNDYVKPPILPDIATMNRAHSTHYTDRPDPGIKYVLRGWKEDGGRPARTSSIRTCACARSRPTSATMRGGTQRHGNSIFIFEVANLCIAHLGHLHHTLNQQQLNEIGRVDVVLVPVDGGCDARPRRHDRGADRAEGAADDPDALSSRATRSTASLDASARTGTSRRPRSPRSCVSKHTLPAKPKLLVLPGR